MRLANTKLQSDPGACGTETDGYIIYHIGNGQW